MEDKGNTSTWHDQYSVLPAKLAKEQAAKRLTPADVLSCVPVAVPWFNRLSFLN